MPQPHVAFVMQSACFEFGFAQPMVQFSCSETSEKNTSIPFNVVPEYLLCFVFIVDLHKASSCRTIL